MARISYVTAEKAPPSVADEYSRLEKERGAVGTVFRMLAHNPAIMTRVIALGEALRGQSKLDRRTQELATLRISYLNQCSYEWAHHLRTLERMETPAEKIAAIANWSESETFDPRERAALRCADEITNEAWLSDDGFAELRSHFDEQETVEVIATVCYYNMATRLVRSIGAELEPEYGDRGETMPHR